MKSNFTRYILLTISLLSTSLSQASIPGLIPLPNHLEAREGTFMLTKRTVIHPSVKPDLDAYLADQISQMTDLQVPISANTPASSAPNAITLKVTKGSKAEAYKLTITPHNITIEGDLQGGLFYGIQTFLQLLPPKSAPSKEIDLPCLEILDSPRYAYRGVMLDVSRTFFDKATVMQYLDWMSRHKLNKFHWHLSDDNGWRLEIKQYPELTSKGAWRGPGEVLAPSYGSGEQRYGGFYTQDDVREIIAYATLRNIEVIPEIELPGHAQTITSIYPQTFCRQHPGGELKEEDMRNVLCASNEDNYVMLNNIFTEIAALFPSKYIHIGADEVSFRYWKNCPHCQAFMRKKGMKHPKELLRYFVHRMENKVHALGKECGVWNEALEGGALRAGTLIYGWENTKVCEDAARRSQGVVMMPASYTYIDMKQGPFERGHNWARMVDTHRVYSFDPEQTNLTAEQQQFVRGVEAAQWGELMDRPERFLEYQGYPRLCALAEVGWTESKKRDWEDFYTRLTTNHLDRLTGWGIRFRMFPPTVSYNAGQIIARSPESTSCSIRYTTDGSEPTAQSPLYTQPITDAKSEHYTFRSFHGNSWSPAVPAMSREEVTLSAGEQRIVRIPLSQYIHRSGIWLLLLSPEQDHTVINRLEVTGPDTTYLIIRNGQSINPLRDIRLYMDPANISAELILTLTNKNTVANPLTISFRPSPYIEPPVRMSSSLPMASRFPAINVQDYNRTSYTRSADPCKSADWILYTFDDPVSCRSIDVRTGIPEVTRYIVTRGEVSYANERNEWTAAGPLNSNGETTIYPTSKVKAVKIDILGSNGEVQIATQDLLIKP